MTDIPLIRKHYSVIPRPALERVISISGRISSCLESWRRGAPCRHAAQAAAMNIHSLSPLVLNGAYFITNLLPVSIMPLTGLPRQGEAPLRSALCQGVSET